MNRDRESAGLINIIPNPNLLINGDMSVAQRGTVFSGDDDKWTLDRWWFADGTGNHFGVRQSGTANNSPLSATNTLRLIRDAVGNEAVIAQPLETKSIVDRTITLSFNTRVTNVKTGVLDYNPVIKCRVFRYENGKISNGGVTTALNSDCYREVVITNSDNWDNSLYSVTFKVPSDGSTGWDRNSYTYGISFQSALSNGLINVGDAFYITNVKLEYGENATPFEPDESATNLAKCLRFYYEMQGSRKHHYVGANASIIEESFPVPMRKDRPTVKLLEDTTKAKINRGANSWVTFTEAIDGDYRLSADAEL